MHVCIHIGRTIFHEKIPNTSSNDCFVFPCSWRVGDCEENLTCTLPPKTLTASQDGQAAEWLQFRVFISLWSYMSYVRRTLRNSAWATRTGLEVATTLSSVWQMAQVSPTYVVERDLNYSGSEAKHGSKEGRSQRQGSMSAEHLQGKLKPREVKGLA